MQNLESRSKFSGRFVVSLRGELGHFAQSNCRKKQEKKPCAATDVSGGATPKKPGDACNGEHDKRSDTPAMIGRAGTPCPGEDEQRRNHREKKQNMI